jgi:hypothetical protein
VRAPARGTAAPQLQPVCPSRPARVVAGPWRSSLARGSDQDRHAGSGRDGRPGRRVASRHRSIIWTSGLCVIVAPEPCWLGESALASSDNPSASTTTSSEGYGAPLELAQLSSPASRDDGRSFFRAKETQALRAAYERGVCGTARCPAAAERRRPDFRRAAHSHGLPVTRSREP